MIEEVTLYRLICDWPGCKQSAQDGGEYVAWAEASSAIEEASDADWFNDHDGKGWYCGNHTMAWASDHEDGDPLPEPPFLLIHDGDDCPAKTCEGDGTVVLVADGAA